MVYSSKEQNTERRKLQKNTILVLKNVLYWIWDEYGDSSAQEGQDGVSPF